MQANQEKINQIRNYEKNGGQNVWQDVIMSWDDLDMNATEIADPNYQSNIAVFEDGSHIYNNGGGWEISEGEFGTTEE